jgi:hypothetical protein
MALTNQRWSEFNLKQQNGNISSELSRVVSLLDRNEIEKAKKAIGYGLEMIGIHKNFIKNKEILRSYEVLANSYLEPDYNDLIFLRDFYLQMAI